MRHRRRQTLPAIVLVAVIAFGLNTARSAPTAGPAGTYRIDAATAARDHLPVLPAATRNASFTFPPGTAPLDRAAFLDAVADARPPARRLIDLVDGLVDVRIGPTGQPRAIGLTQPGRRYTVTVDLGVVSRTLGRRGIDRVVLHELGHVVAFALVPDDVMARLQAGIPLGYGCEQGISGACASAPERFAESFAKWSNGDIGVDLGAGYKVLPPTPTLEAWGEPLARLGR